jgi:hypothetical protein
MNCSHQQIKTKELVFTSPTIFNNFYNGNDSIEIIKYKANKLMSVDPSFIGIYKFGDSIDITPTDDPELQDRIYENVKDTIQGNSLTGLELIVDYDTDVYSGGRENTFFNCYPVYLVNNTNSGKIIYGKDRHVFGLQEAFTNEEYGASWKPIEMKGFDFCGNGHWTKIIQPKEFALLLFVKYDGTEKHTMRVRFKNGANILVSNTFEGMINPKQFTVEKESSTYDRLKRVEAVDQNLYQEYFYGAKVPSINEGKGD